MIICPECGTRNRFFYNFCFNCGTMLDKDNIEKDEERTLDNPFSLIPPLDYFKNYSSANSDAESSEESTHRNKPIYDSNETDADTDDAADDLTAETLETDDAADDFIILSPDMDSSLHSNGTEASNTHYTIDNEDTETADAFDKGDDAEKCEDETTGSIYDEDEDETFGYSYKEGKDDYIFEEMETAKDEISSYFDDDYSTAFGSTSYLSSRKYRRERKKYGSRRTSSSIFMTVATILIVISVLAAAALIFRNFIIKPEAIWVKPSVEQIVTNGESTHKITIQTNPGNKVLINNVWHTAYQGTVEIVLNDLMFIQESGADTPVIDISLPVTVSKRGLSDENLYVNYSIDVEESSLEVLLPQDTHIETTEDYIKIVLKTTAKSRILINDNDYSDMVNEDGRLEVNYPLTSPGDHMITIYSKNRNMYPKTHTITAYKYEPAVKLNIAPNVQKRTIDDTVKITGTTEVNAQISTDAELRGEITNNNGVFSMEAVLSYLGRHVIGITASKEDGTSSYKEIQIIKEPSANTYTRSAWLVPYNDLQRYMRVYNGRNVVFKGKVQEVHSTGDITTFTMDVGYDSGNPGSDLIFIEVLRDMKITEGEILRVFGDVDGYYDENKRIPKLLGWFFYK